MYYKKLCKLLNIETIFLYIKKMWRTILNIINDTGIYALKKQNVGLVSLDKNSNDVNLPIGHYYLGCSRLNPNNLPTRITIYGLGSCIALILYDRVNNIYGMSHILLPSQRGLKKEKISDFPHKYADTSARALFNDLLSLGAVEGEIRAIIAGGADIFQNYSFEIGKDNITAIKKELFNLGISIEKENLGGNKGRSVIFETQNYSLLVKQAGDEEYMRLI